MKTTRLVPFLCASLTWAGFSSLPVQAQETASGTVPAARLSTGGGATPSSATEAKPQTEAQKLINGFMKERTAWSMKAREAKTAEERSALMKAQPSTKEVSVKLMELLKAAPKGEEAVTIISFLAGSLPQASSDLLTIAADHLENAELQPMVLRMAAKPNASDAEKAFLAAAEKSSLKEIKGAVSFGALSRLEYADEAAYVSAAQAFLKDYADFSIGGRPVAKRIEGKVNAMTKLAIGKEAPEIVGADVDGKPMKLSDYRGKVVVLDFWGHW